MEIEISHDILSICRLDRGSEIPSWAFSSSFLALVKTAEEVSIVCEEGLIPLGIKNEGGWRALKVKGPLDFGLTGILASLTAPLALEKISIFAISTFDTDYILVREWEKAVHILTSSGHAISDCDKSNFSRGH